VSEYIRPGEAAKLLGVSRDSIGRYMENGTLKGIRTPGNQRRIERDSIEALKGLATRPSSIEGK
jgi:excisionase family DNA binding protein